jgi:hypothetical protein
MFFQPSQPKGYVVYTDFGNIELHPFAIRFDYYFKFEDFFRNSFIIVLYGYIIEAY